jgi:hypothetical protein
VFRLALLLAALLLVTWCSTTVKLGEHTCAGHVKRIWSSDETVDLRKGVKEKATSDGTREVLEDVAETTAPVVDRVKRGVKAGLKEAAESDAAKGAAGATKEAAKEAAEKAAKDEVRRRTE